MNERSFNLMFIEIVEFKSAHLNELFMRAFPLGLQVAGYIFDDPGRLRPIILLSGLFAATGLGIGLLASTFANTQQEAMLTVWMMHIPFGVFLSPGGDAAGITLALLLDAAALLPGDHSRFAFERCQRGCPAAGNYRSGCLWSRDHVDRRAALL